MAALLPDQTAHHEGGRREMKVLDHTMSETRAPASALMRYDTLHCVFVYQLSFRDNTLTDLSVDLKKKTKGYTTEILQC